MLPTKKFDIEHALSLYASSFVVMPASGIYEEEVVRRFKPNLQSCHIYLIGEVEKVDLIDVRQSERSVITTCSVAGKPLDLSWPMPSGSKLIEGEEGWAIQTADGDRLFPAEEAIMQRLNYERNALTFDVLYIGQAYGDDGSRNALDRLLQHGTLQKIAVQGGTSGRRLNLLMLEIVSGNRMITNINPRATESRSDRISRGLDKLFGTNEAERVALYEASLIRYFQPKYNIKFKDSFPSTNMKVLADCYDKDFAGLVSEICIDELPFKLCSQVVPPSQYHIAKFDLHEDEARRFFFR